MSEPKTTDVCRSCNKEFEIWRTETGRRPPVFCQECFHSLTPHDRMRLAVNFSTKRRRQQHVETFGETKECLACGKEYKAMRYSNGQFRRFCKACWDTLNKDERRYFYNEEQKKRRIGPYAIHKPEKPSTDEDLCLVPACRETADLNGFCMFHYRGRHRYLIDNGD